MTASETLREMLDERGVEWQAPSDNETWWETEGNNHWSAEENGDGEYLTFEAITCLTPAQAIAATLGSEDTYTREDVEGAFVSGYSLGLDMFDSSKPEKGWNQNERNLDEEMEDLGWVRKDAATLGAGTCQLKRASWDDGTCTWGCICSACDAHLEHETGIGYNYCPICGAKVVDE